MCDTNPNQTHGANSYNPRTRRFHCTNLLTAVPNDYSEPIFDSTSTPAASGDNDYSFPQDAIVPAADSPSPHCAVFNKHSYPNFVQPADSLVLLFNRINQTNVKDISRSSIKYVNIVTHIIAT